MQAREYESLFSAEGQLWWFRAMRRFIDVLLPMSKRGKRVLDIGCGTGALMRHIASQGNSVMGIDFSRTGIDFAKQESNGLVAQATAEDLPFASNSLDAVTCVDLLELGSLQPARLVAEAVRVLRPGGHGLFVAAAHQWLLSEHDRAVGSTRRFELGELRALFSQQSVRVVRGTYLFTLLFPLIALRKLLNRPKEGESRSDVSLIPGIINEPLYWLCAIESLVLRFAGFAFGSSVVVLVEKNA